MENINTYKSKNGWNLFLSDDDFKLLYNFLGKYNNLEYLGHGGTAFAFKSGNNIMKVCIKNTKMLLTKEKFIGYANLLSESGIKILPPKEILFENDKILIYTQDKCIPISEINAISLIKILEIIKNLTKKFIKIPDLFHKNFGIFNNDIYLYDYHEYDYFFSNDKYYISHMAHMFNLYFYGKLLNGLTFNTEKLREIDYGKEIFCENIVNLLKNLDNYQVNEAINNFDLIICDLKNKIKCSYDDYQHLDITCDGQIILRSHTLEKFKIAEKITNMMGSEFTLADHGCSLGGIGSLIAQRLPKSKIYLNNITKNELKICNEIKNNLLLENVTVSNMNVVEDHKIYDVCLYFAVLHHILKSMTFDDVMKIILHQVHRYTVIELPFGNDSLLKNVISMCSISYDKSFGYLESLDKFINEISKYFKIIEYSKIDYGTDKLNRYAFILEKIR